MTQDTKARGQAQTMTGQKAVNAIMRTLLRTPLVSRGIGKRLVIVNVVGRKSGKQYSIPVAYTPRDATLLIGTPFAWGRNLRTGEPVEIVLQGRRRQADVEVISDEAGVVRYYDIICRANKAFAGFNKITIGPDGTPDPEDLHRAWSNRSRVLILTPR